jgi:hypothetical protein
MLPEAPTTGKSDGVNVRAFVEIDRDRGTVSIGSPPLHRPSEASVFGRG